MIKKILLSTVLSFLFIALRSQNPCNWTFMANKMQENIYEIHCKVEVKSPWHTYSQFTPAGGPVPTRFVFAKNPLFVLVGSPREEGKIITKHEEVFGVDVKYFEEKVDFIQQIRLKTKAKTNITGSVTFMVCDDHQCLPPATETFSVSLN